MKPSPKVFSIGLDGGTFDLMDPWLHEGHLPNIQRLIERGTRASLRSVILPFTPQAWGSFMTGMNPGNHGVFGFKEKEEGRYSFQFVNNKSIRSRTLWKYLSDHGKKAILVNIPMTYPPEPIEGIIVGGMDSPGVDSDFTYPSDIKSEILALEKDYVIHLHVGAGYLDSDKKRRKAVGALLHMVASREKVILHFMDKYPWDFFAVNFSAIDQVQHHFWKYLERDNEFQKIILKIYKRVDEAVGRICEKVSPKTTVYMMSDHGAGPASPYVIFIDEWLKEQGLLQFRKAFSVRGLAMRMVKSALTAFSQKLSSEIKDHLMRWFPSMRVRSQGYVRRALIDWPNTRAYSGEHPSTLRINLKGRDAQGVVEPGDYEGLRRELIERLESLTHPQTGEILIERVYRKEDLYHGDFLQAAPDLIIHPKDFAHQIKGGPFSNPHYRQVISTKDPKEFFVNGVHRLNGIFAAAGPGIREGHCVDSLEIIDLFPTMLYSLGMAVPKSVDGKVAEGIFEEDRLSAYPIGYCDDSLKEADQVPGDKATYGQEDADRIAESLRGLGYID
jgi:predicted AlkP superfamily phosphohydrolase/phosphomutase